MSNTQGIDRIINKISSEADEFCSEILKTAEIESIEIFSSYQKKSTNLEKEIIDKANKLYDEKISNAKSSASLFARNELLSLKISIIEEVFENAKKTMSNMSDDEKIKFFSALLLKAVKENITEKSSGEVLFSENFKSISTNIMQNIKASNLSVSNKTIKSTGGFILKCGDIEINCTFEALMQDSKNKLEKKVSDILFEQ